MIAASTKEKRRWRARLMARISFLDSDLVRIERAPIVHRLLKIFSTLSATGANAFGRFGYNGL
jgi:hypothetical protein